MTVNNVSSSRRTHVEKGFAVLANPFLYALFGNNLVFNREFFQQGDVADAFDFDIGVRIFIAAFVAEVTVFSERESRACQLEQFIVKRIAVNGLRADVGAVLHGKKNRGSVGVPDFIIADAVFPVVDEHAAPEEFVADVFERTMADGDGVRRILPFAAVRFREGTFEDGRFVGTVKIGIPEGVRSSNQIEILDVALHVFFLKRTPVGDPAAEGAPADAFRPVFEIDGCEIAEEHRIAAIVIDQVVMFSE